MKGKLTTLILIVLVALFMGGCATTYKPIPIGDELVWTSDDKRPGWSVDTPEVDDGDYLVFVGQSLYHGTERAARNNAQVDASRQAATYLAHQLKRNYIETATGTAAENQTQNLDVTINETVELTADQVLSKLEVEDWYIEQWRKGGETFFKVFVKTKLPKARL